MDPVAAIGLAANIVQFVDFSWKLLDEAKYLYDSTTGASQDNDLLELISNDLNVLNDKLTAASASGAIPNPIRTLAGQCKDLADELLYILDTIKVSGRHRKWRSFLQALRSVWKQEQIEKLVKRLETLRGAMQMRLQVILSEKNSEILKTLTDLVAENRRLAMDSAHQLESLVLGVRSAISQLKQEVKGQEFVVNTKLEVVQISPPTDVDAMTASQIMGDLATKLSVLAEQIGATASDQILLNSLWFNNLRQRQENVAHSHEKTFKWVLNPSSPTNFEHWLRHQDGLYWITGKAGSGKSTLMKYLINHPDVAKASKAWAGVQRLVTASFFFWNAGTAIQKSQEGLFKSLLYEILRQCPDMIRTVCASKAETFRPFTKEFEPWTRQELWHAIGQLKHYSASSARFCFFIDGLDEYDGDPDRLVDVLENLRSWQSIKLCVSSRPWNEFIDAFGGSSDAQLAMEDLTREDIRVYVRETLEESLLFRRLDARDPRSQDLVREIVEKARGVFLWVTLVVKSLLTGLKNADRIPDLEMRLRDFPGTLEQYFSQMLHSVEVIYRKQTAQAFKFALEAAEPLSLLTYSFLDEEDLDATLTSTRDLLTIDDILTRQDDMQKRLNGRCKGLLEVVRGEVTSQDEVLKVDFLHRTVYDFLLTKDMRNMLDENLGPEFEPKIRLCKAFLAQMKLTRPHQFENRSSQLLEDLTFHAVALETVSGIPQVGIMNAVRDVVLERESTFGVAGGRAGFLDFLIHRGFHLYITETLKSKPEVSPSTKTALLGSALEPRETKYCNALYDTKMIRLLLDHGAAPNGRYKKSTVWGRFLLTIRQKSREAVTDDLKQIIGSLLRYGANPHLRIITGHRTVASPILSGRAADLHRKPRSVENIIKSAQEILTQLLGPAEARELLSKARNPQPSLKSLVSRLMSWESSGVRTFYEQRQATCKRWRDLMKASGDP